jgi:hypothetical protein
MVGQEEKEDRKVHLIRRGEKDHRKIHARTERERGPHSMRFRSEGFIIKLKKNSHTNINIAGGGSNSLRSLSEGSKKKSLTIRWDRGRCKTSKDKSDRLRPTKREATHNIGGEGRSDERPNTEDNVYRTLTRCERSSEI